MKQIIYGCLMGIIVIMFLSVFLTIHAKASHREEIEQALERALASSMELWQQDKEAGLSMKQDEFVGIFVELLLAQLDSESDVEIQVLKADVEKGLLDVELVSDYVQNNGSHKKLCVRRSILYEQKQTL